MVLSARQDNVATTGQCLRVGATVSKPTSGRHSKIAAIVPLSRLVEVGYLPIKLLTMGNLKVLLSKE